MNRREHQGVGDEIKDILQDVMNTRNFNRLNQDIGRTINNALNDFETVIFGKPKYSGDDVLWEPLSTEPPKKAEIHEKKKEHQPRAHQSGKGYVGAGNGKSIPGSVSGVLLIVFGFLGIGLLAGSLAIYGVVSAFMNIGWAVNGITVGAALPFLAISSVMAAKGIQLRKRVTRARRYITRLNGRSYCNIKELAAVTGKSEKSVAKDLQKMISVGIFPHGHIDQQKTCLMLDDATYKQYMETLMWTQQQKELAEKQKDEEKAEASRKANEDDAQRNLRATVEEGKSYIRQIQKANDDIPGEEVSRKLDRLETVISKIFQHIETHPEQISEIRKFMNYYLPTTLKLTTTYIELNNQPVEGENISSAKQEIQNTLDTISLAFEKLLDKLFFHAAMDVSSDISVLETMFAQEGLSAANFIKNNSTEGKL